MPNAQVAIVTPRSIRRRRSWRRFLGRGTRALVPASCLSNGAADSQLGAELKTGLQFLARDYGCSARPPQPAVYRSICVRSVCLLAHIY
jgi:hypothetical protein